MLCFAVLISKRITGPTSLLELPLSSLRENLSVQTLLEGSCSFILLWHLPAKWSLRRLCQGISGISRLFRKCHLSIKMHSGKKITLNSLMSSHPCFVKSCSPQLIILFSLIKTQMFSYFHESRLLGNDWSSFKVNISDWQDKAGTELSYCFYYLYFTNKLHVALFLMSKTVE